MGADPAEGPGLIFVILPSIFPQLVGGAVWSTLFFRLLFMAALTSAISILEVVTAYFIDQNEQKKIETKMKLKGAPFYIAITSGIIFIVGLLLILPDFRWWQQKQRNSSIV